ncbi:rhythmically expressed gene 5 protein [Drosophila rhopaloa]|uniref:Rhythmically expressed gene 5 protein n=1 Tax=Drosophila rhopaloa TaxID=1041015 RepID=A0A6P4EM56_DRORH|nr:rhythmically expressed gene 5 protein [Drosophila rhopaloa]
MTTAAKVILACCLLGAIHMQIASSSAIPIWEFLTRNEKMSHLYSTFAQLVSVHCKSTAAVGGLPVNQCKHNLLTFGSAKLQTLSDAQLESLDPYQRDANELIWSSIMRDHPSGASLVTTRQPLQQPLPTPPASSLIILTRQQLPHEAYHPVQSASPGANPIFESGEQKHKYAMDMDMAYGYPSVQQSSSELPVAAALTSEPPKSYLTGPLVIRVRTDGSPVEEDRRMPLPRDEDLPYFRLGLAAAPAGANRHRKIATISALKQQHFASILQRDLQPPHQVQRRLFRQQQA